MSECTGTVGAHIVLYACMYSTLSYTMPGLRFRLIDSGFETFEVIFCLLAGSFYEIIMLNFAPFCSP